MKTHNPHNERIKRAYFTYLAEAKGFSEPTLDGVAKAMNRFETYTKFRDFKGFHIEQAKSFKASLAEQTSLRTKDHLSKATLYATLSALKRSSSGWPGSQGTSPGFRTPMPNISTCRPRRRGSPRPIGTSVCRPWSRSGTSSRRCRRVPRSSAATEPSLRSPS
jgi:hypothetical protein